MFGLIEVVELTRAKEMNQHERDWPSGSTHPSPRFTLPRGRAETDLADPPDAQSCWQDHRLGGSGTSLGSSGFSDSVGVSAADDQAVPLLWPLKATLGVLCWYIRRGRKGGSRVNQSNAATWRARSLHICVSILHRRQKTGMSHYISSSKGFFIAY